MRSRPRSLLFAIVVTLLAGVFVALGFWQLHRLAERRAENADRRQRLERPPIALPSERTHGPIPSDSAAWRRVVLEGRFDYAREIVLAPRSFDGTPGVFVLTPLRPVRTDPAGGEEGGPRPAVPVLRGAIPAPDGFHAPLARARPPAAAGDDVVRVRGIALVPEGHEGENTADTLRAAGGRHPVLAQLDLESVRRRLPYPVSGFYVQATGSTEAIPPADGIRLPRPLPRPSLDDGPHLFYALQWFAFAAITLIGGGAFLWTRRRRRSGRPTGETA